MQWYIKGGVFSSSFCITQGYWHNVFSPIKADNRERRLQYTGDSFEWIWHHVTIEVHPRGQHTPVSNTTSLDNVTFSCTCHLTSSDRYVSASIFWPLYHTQRLAPRISSAAPRIVFEWKTERSFMQCLSKMFISFMHFYILTTTN